MSCLRQHFKALRKLLLQQMTFLGDSYKIGNLEEYIQSEAVFDEERIF